MSTTTKSKPKSKQQQGQHGQGKEELYQSYQDAVLSESPMIKGILGLLCCGCDAGDWSNSVGRYLYATRWFLAQPFQLKIFNVVSVGHVLLTLPLLLWLWEGGHYAFIAPDTDASGWLAAYCIGVVFLSANKSNSVFSFLFGVPYDQLIWFHLLASLTAVILGVFHAYVALGSDWSLLFDDYSNQTGTILLAAMAILVATSMFRDLFRKYAYQLWFALHMILVLTVIVMMILHECTIVIVPVTVWFALDLFYRYAFGGRYRLQAQVRALPCTKSSSKGNTKVTEVRIKRSTNTNLFDYAPGQFVRICIPSISVLEYHPISISSAPQDEDLTLHIGALGNWSSKLYKHVQNATNNNNNANLEMDILLEGPYGATKIDLEAYEVFLFVSGGIGITPCQSIANALIAQQQSNDNDSNSNKKILRFVWATRDQSLVQELQPIPQEVVQSDLISAASQLRTGTSRTVSRGMSQSLRDVSRSSASSHPTSPTADMAGRASSTFLSSSSVAAQVDVYLTRQKIIEENDLEQGRGRGRKQQRRSSSTSSGAYNYEAGRPDMFRIVDETREAALGLGASKVAVVACGPTTLVKDLTQACQQHSHGKDKVLFDIHTEAFEL